MVQFSRTWWGQRFLAALEEFTDPGRLGRGRSYASGGRILDYRIEHGAVRARVRGSVNPYYGITKEPIYRTTIEIAPIAAADWARVIERIAARADYVTKLLMNEMPDTIEEAFSGLHLHLLPHSARDFTTTCSCPDYANPCKHIAGLYYVLAAALDQDPLVIFALRGLSREALHAELSRSPLGQVLDASLSEEVLPPEPTTSYFTRPIPEPTAATVSLREFWGGSRRLPPLAAMPERPGVSALLIKTQGDHPAFWHKDGSFIGVMEDLYERVRTKSPQMK